MFPNMKLSPGMQLKSYWILSQDLDGRDGGLVAGQDPHTVTIGHAPHAQGSVTAASHQVITVWMETETNRTSSPRSNRR